MTNATMKKWLFESYFQDDAMEECQEFSSNFENGDAYHFRYAFIGVAICVVMLYGIFAVQAYIYGKHGDWYNILDPRKMGKVQERVNQEARRASNLEWQHLTNIIMFFVPPTITLGIIQCTNFTTGFISALVLAAVFTFVDPGIFWAHNLTHETRSPESPESAKPPVDIDKLCYEDRLDYWDGVITVKDKPNKQKKIKDMSMRNIYQAPSSFTMVVAVFVVQVSLSLFYIGAVWEGGRPCFQESRQFFFFYAGNLMKGLCFLIIQDLVTDENLCNDRKYWRYTLWALHCDGCRIIKGRERPIVITGVLNWKIRHWMSVFVNGYLRMTIFFLMTIQVSQSPKSMDFVLNLIAAVFIFEIDDYGNWGADKPNVRIESPEEDRPASSSTTP